MDFIQRSKDIFRQEIDELQSVAARIGDEINQAIELIVRSKGKLVVIGVGKTGIIGRKISASLASTGTPSVFIHAAEAIHGDLGMIQNEDVILLISNSGSSTEILNVLPPLKSIGCKLIAMTGNIKSALARESDVVLNINVSREACPLGLAPTSSTTAALVMGDALTICLMENRNFQPENYALYHPGGALGRQLLIRVKDVMTTDIPKVGAITLMKDVIYEVSNKRLGMTLVYGINNTAEGIITDGDIRRAIQKYDEIKALKASEIMSTGFKSIDENALLTDALEKMDENNITTLAVTSSNDNTTVTGVISIHHIIDFR